MKDSKKLPWVLAACFCALFLLLLVLLLTVDVAPIAADGGNVGLSTLNDAVRNAIGVNPTLYKIAEWTGYLALLLAAGFALFGLVQLIRRRSLAKIDRELFVLAGLYIAALACYLFFEIFVVNVRPTAPEASFPSSHTVLAITFFGSGAMLCRKYLQNRALRVCAQILLIVVLFATTLCRFFSGVHWLTDVLGGVFLGLALLSLFSAFLDRFSTKQETAE